MNNEIDYSLFKLQKEYFDNDSSQHGINHTYRVMCLVLYVGRAAGLERDILLAFCAAFIHDFARKHDGYCDQHGLWAAQYKLPEFISLFKKIGVSQNEIKIINLAVKNHSELQEIENNHDAYKATALLKDADALDRIRLGGDNLNQNFLRFPESIGLITFAKQLYLKTQYIKISSFVEILEIAKLINH
ncbi:MAG: HD domain-containing protein [Bacteroidales bacterium]|nr:HD domain-containing protein [Bacteroidales bacterium]